MADTKYEQLHPSLQKVYTEAKASYIQDHPGDVFLPRLDTTYRSNAVQTAYYAQGRQALAIINHLRKLAGLDSIGLAEAKRIITYKKPGASKHNLFPSQAFDVIFVKDGKASWNEQLYLDFGKYVKTAANKLGIKVAYGGDWKMKDYPHSELA